MVPIGLDHRCIHCRMSFKRRRTRQKGMNRFSFYFKASRQWHMGMAHNRCAKQKNRAKIFLCFKLENKASSRSAPPTTSVASLYTLEFFWRPWRCGCSTIRGRRVWPENTHCLLTSVKGRAAIFPKRSNWRQDKMLEISWRPLRSNTVLFEILLT